MVKKVKTKLSFVDFDPYRMAEMFQITNLSHTLYADWGKVSVCSVSSQLIETKGLQPKIYVVGLFDLCAHKII